MRLLPVSPSGVVDIELGYCKPLVPREGVCMLGNPGTPNVGVELEMGVGLFDPVPIGGESSSAVRSMTWDVAGTGGLATAIGVKLMIESKQSPSNTFNSYVPIAAIACLAVTHSRLHSWTFFSYGRFIFVTTSPCGLALRSVVVCTSPLCTNVLKRLSRWVLSACFR